MSELPFYLQHKLSIFAIYTVADLKKHNYLKTFAWLKDKFPSISYKTLYDLHCLVNRRSLNNLTKLEQQDVLAKYKLLPPCYAPLTLDTINYYLNLANDQAQLALANNEIPIGAVVVRDNQVIATGYNQTISANSSMLHAEIVSIKEAQTKLETIYLDECDLYVTIEPCLMCSGAIISSRIKRVIFGALEPKTGAGVSQYEVFNNKAVNHHTEVIGPIDNKKYSAGLKQFLKAKR